MVAGWSASVACPRTARSARVTASASAASRSACGVSACSNGRSASTASALAVDPAGPRTPSATASSVALAYAVSSLESRTVPVSQRAAYRKVVSDMVVPLSLSLSTRSATARPRAAVSALTRRHQASSASAAATGGRPQTVRISASGIPARRSPAISRARSRCSGA